MNAVVLGVAGPEVLRGVEGAVHEPGEEVGRGEVDLGGEGAALGGEEVDFC